VTAARALLRFLHVSGRTPALLAGAVPAVAGWRLASLPRGLPAAEVERLLDGCDRETVVGRRDYAILTVLARLGVRGAEVAALRLGDIAWQAGEVVIRGKGSRLERLPLPVPVGAALAAYLTGGRARCESPAVFVTVRAPHRQLSPEAVRAIMGRACDRAGLARRGAHRLRHSLATEMLRAVAARGRAGAPASQPASPRRSMPRIDQKRAAHLGAPMARRCALSTLRAAAGEYLAMRRALGFKLTTQGTAPDELHRLLRSPPRPPPHHGPGAGLGHPDLAWQQRRGLLEPLMVVRIFARHLKTLDPATEIPPEDVLPHHYRRIAPYLYSPGEITAVMAAAARLTPPLRAATWQTLIGLLAVTGLRQGEACRLDRGHVDLETGVLVVTDSKFGKSRQVFLHHSAIGALRSYQQVRDRFCPSPAEHSFFVSTRGSRLDNHNIQHTFAELADAARIHAPPGRRRPRLHDLRHSFTVATLLDWYHDGGDVQARLPLLSTWLGHADPKSTYWYLQAVPELLALAAGRLEQTFPFGQVPA
jgi:integrase